MKKDLVVVINGAGTNGMELKGLYNRLKKNDEYFVYYPGYFAGAFIGDYFPNYRVRDFKKFIDETIEIINEDWRHVYLIGYSLGAATAAIIANRVEKIDKLVLIAPIIKNPNYNKFLRGLSASLAYSKHLSRVQKIFYHEFIRRFTRVPKINIWNLQRYLFYTKKYLRNIKVDTLIVETLKDELVKQKSINQLEKNIEGKVDRFQVNSSHFLFFDRTVREKTINKIESFLEED
ncbi:MAG: alpha/beta hydrolase [Candidatus Izemoplasmataceae bacterium]